MSACRRSTSSLQAMAKLLAKQSAGRAVKPIQDVVTCWWSTDQCATDVCSSRLTLD